MAIIDAETAHNRLIAAARRLLPVPGLIDDLSEETPINLQTSVAAVRQLVKALRDAEKASPRPSPIDIATVGDAP